MRRLFVPSLVAVVAVLSACAPEPPTGPPETISGDGTVASLVLTPDLQIIESTKDATFSLTLGADGDYSGEFDSGLGPMDLTVLTSERSITGIYSFGAGIPDGSVTVSVVSDSPRCPDTAALRLDQLSSGGGYSGRVVMTICDPAAAAWFGPVPAE